VENNANIKGLSNGCRNDFLHRRAKINTTCSTSILQHIVCSTGWLCLIPMGVKFCHESSTFKVNLMALDNNPMHVTMLCLTPLHLMC